MGGRKGLGKDRNVEEKGIGERRRFRERKKG